MEERRKEERAEKKMIAMIKMTVLILVTRADGSVCKNVAQMDADVASDGSCRPYLWEGEGERSGEIGG